MLIAADGADGNRLQLEKVGPNFSISTIVLEKKRKKTLKTSYGVLISRLNESHHRIQVNTFTKFGFVSLCSIQATSRQRPAEFHTVNLSNSEMMSPKSIVPNVSDFLYSCNLIKQLAN